MSPETNGSGTPSPLGGQARVAANVAVWMLLFLASPGILSPNGAWPLALLAFVPWALANSRPGPRAFLLEWLVAGLGSAALCVWSAYVWWGTLGFIALVPGLYAACAGAVLRRLAPHMPLVVAAPAAWILFEVPRCLVQPPFGYGWMRLGTYVHDVSWLAGSARVWGVFGLSVVLAACAGGIADHLRGRPRGFALGLVPVLLAVLLSFVVKAPETRDGPRLLLIQPAVEQARKQVSASRGELFAESRALTIAGLRGERARGEAEPDLVVWGETMLPLPAMEEGLEQAYARGVRSPEWTRDDIAPAGIAWSRGREQAWVGGALFGWEDHERVLPEGASFLSGCELYLVRDEEIRRTNAVVLWDEAGERVGFGGKLHLVPGGENLAGAERLAWIRNAAQSIAGYVPDLVAIERTEVLVLEARDGRATWHMGVTVCFDNIFDDPYTEPLRRGPLDFHLICSNEAWYLDSFEMDQMVAFSRLIAIETGRSMVRATNAGVTIVLGPDGGEVARLVREGQDRMVAGTLAVTVPIPVDGAQVPPYARLERLWLALWGIGPGLLLAFALVRGRSRAS